MGWVRWLLLVSAAVVVGWAGYLLYSQLSDLRSASRALVVPLKPGDQEIAYIQPATSGAAWQRFVEGLRYLRDGQPDLHIELDDTKTNLDHTTAVPEIGIRVAGARRWLRIRWYKLTSELGHREWVEALAARNPPPLAIIGGSSSDRARDLALELRERYTPPAEEDAGQPPPPADGPLLIITTATADTVRLHGQTEHGEPISERLMDIYRGRSYRFCFTNRQMARAVVDLIRSHPELLSKGGTPKTAIMTWLDDPYSIDLTEQFDKQFDEQGLGKADRLAAQYTVGDFSMPNAEEAALLPGLIETLRNRDDRSLLVLPTVDKPARRVVRALADAAPLAARKLVVATGDSISFNTIFRDRDTAWNVQELPVTLVFFCHDNPLHPKANNGDSGSELAVVQANDDLLLNAAIIERLVVAAYPSSGELATTPDALAAGLRAAKLADGSDFFTPSGNRRQGSGEYVVCLRPTLEEDRVLPKATIEIWSCLRVGDGPPVQREWKLVENFDVRYGKGGSTYGPR